MDILISTTSVIEGRPVSRYPLKNILAIVHRRGHPYQPIAPTSMPMHDACFGSGVHHERLVDIHRRDGTLGALREGCLAEARTRRSAMDAAAELVKPGLRAQKIGRHRRFRDFHRELARAGIPSPRMLDSSGMQNLGSWRFLAERFNEISSGKSRRCLLTPGNGRRPYPISVSESGRMRYFRSAQRNERRRASTILQRRGPQPYRRFDADRKSGLKDDLRGLLERRARRCRWPHEGGR